MDKEFLEELEKEFQKRYKSDKKIQALVKALESGNVTAEDAFEFSKQVGNLRKLILHEYITEEHLTMGYMQYTDAKALFDDVLYKNYELIDKYCKDAFTAVNKNAGVALKGVSASYSQEKTDGIIQKAKSELYETVRDEVEEAVSTNAKSYYDSSCRTNAKFQYESGLRPKLIRTAVGKTCKWCSEIAGTYDYYEVSDTGNDVFRRHANCDCIVVYRPQKGRYQDVYTKQWTKEEETKRLERIERSNNYKKAR